MSVSNARLRANQRNAKKSTGPVSEEGKQKARMNAFKHGLRARGDTVGPDEEEAVAERMEAWAPNFPAEDEYQKWLVEQVVVASVRINHCQEHERQQAKYDAERAAEMWDADRELEAMNLFDQLRRDPTKAAARLRMSSQGINLLLPCWRLLAWLIEEGTGWDDLRKAEFLDLLGSPWEERESDLAMIEETSAEDLLAVVRDEIAALEERLESVLVIEEHQRSQAERGTPTREGQEMRRLRRYEREQWSRYHQAKADWEAARAAKPAWDFYPLRPSSAPADEPPAATADEADEAPQAESPAPEPAGGDDGNAKTDKELCAASAAEPCGRRTNPPAISADATPSSEAGPGGDQDLEEHPTFPSSALGHRPWDAL